MRSGPGPGKSVLECLERASHFDQDEGMNYVEMRDLKSMSQTNSKMRAFAMRIVATRHVSLAIRDEPVGIYPAWSLYVMHDNDASWLEKQKRIGPKLLPMVQFIAKNAVLSQLKLDITLPKVAELCKIYYTRRHQNQRNLIPDFHQKVSEDLLAISKFIDEANQKADTGVTSRKAILMEDEVEVAIKGYYDVHFLTELENFLIEKFPHASQRNLDFDRKRAILEFSFSAIQP